MNVHIVHDSQKGNGKQIADKLATEFTSRGARVEVGHRTELTPERVAANPPDLLVVGTAVRKFVTSPPTKKWISRLAAEMKRHNAKVPRAAVFFTHAMPDSMVEGRVRRLQRSLSQSGGVGEVYAEWLSGQVKAIPGPLVEGTLERATAFAAKLHAWAQPKS